MSASDGLVWQGLHPVTPFVWRWAVVAAALVILGQQSIEYVEEAAELTASVGGVWWKVLLGIVALAAVALGYSALAWRMTAYAVDERSAYMRKGVLFRQQRSARLDRVQAIDIRQPLLARFFGLSELTLEVAGGAGSAVAIGFLKDDEARRLRAELLARAAGVQVATGQARAAGAAVDGLAPDGSAGAAQGPHEPDQVAGPSAAGAGAGLPGLPEVPEAPEELLFELPPSLLVRSLVRSPVVWLVLASIVGVVVAVVVTRQVGILASALPGVLGGGSYLFQRFTGEFGFRMALAPDGIRLRHGLLETRSQTIPPGRVQAVSLTQGPLWRGPDWWRVRVNVAGYGDITDASQSQSVLLPVGSREQALTALWLVLPDLGVEDPGRLLDEGLTGMVPRDGGQPARDASDVRAGDLGATKGAPAVPSGDGEPRRFVNAPRRARWLDPLSWRRDAFAVTERALLLRGGRLVRRLSVVPHERTQSLAIGQGPWQRRLGLATFTVHSTPGPVVPSVAHLDADDAAQLLAEQAHRARAARAQAGPERWMERPGGEDGTS